MYNTCQQKLVKCTWMLIKRVGNKVWISVGPTACTLIFSLHVCIPMIFYCIWVLYYVMPCRIIACQFATWDIVPCHALSFFCVCLLRYVMLCLTLCCVMSYVLLCYAKTLRTIFALIYKKINKFFSLKCETYYAFTFQP